MLLKYSCGFIYLFFVDFGGNEDFCIDNTKYNITASLKGANEGVQNHEAIQ